ncbi:MAG: lysophospholipase [Planctomycetes bacterium]|nr:lysophospholipase [Planctomycetota bacterium]
MWIAVVLHPLLRTRPARTSLATTTFRSRIASVLARSVALASCSWTGGCLAPPVLLPPIQVDLERALPRYPQGTERVELALASGERLRGLFVPSDEGAPIVLHLLESSGSVGSARLDYGELCAELSDVGFASLLIDYTGIGLSDGEASADHLERDARAMWEEAVRRAGGDPGRVVVRGVSLGAISSALLLKGGARPRSILLLAPVLEDSVVARFARAFRGPLAGWFAGLVYRRAADVSVVEAIRGGGVPVFLVSGDDDPLLDEGDRRALDQAASANRGGLFRREGDHVLVSIEAHSLLREERPLLGRLFPEGPPAAKRLQGLLASLPPDIAARFEPGTAGHARLADLSRHCRVGDPVVLAAAASGSANGESAARMVWLHRKRAWPALPFDDLAASLSLDDPARDLPLDLVEDYSRTIDLPRSYGGAWRVLDGDSIVAAAQGPGIDTGVRTWSLGLAFLGGVRVELATDLSRLYLGLRARGLAEDDARRQFARILLKGQRIPDRLTRAPDGRLVLEALEGGAWRALDLARPPAQAPEVRFEGKWFADLPERGFGQPRTAQVALRRSSRRHSRRRGGGPGSLLGPRTSRNRPLPPPASPCAEKLADRKPKGLECPPRAFH